jgi:hypothetical protein
VAYRRKLRREFDNLVRWFGSCQLGKSRKTFGIRGKYIVTGCKIAFLAAYLYEGIFFQTSLLHLENCTNAENKPGKIDVN